MSKRKLTKQQKWRVDKIQTERTQRTTRGERDIDRQLQSGELGDEQHGMIIAHYGRQLDVEGKEGEHAGKLFRCHVRSNIDSLVTGDRVIWRPASENGGVIVAREDRRSILIRPDNFGQLKPVAANIDHLIIVIAPEPLPHDNLIDRYLVASETTGIAPILLMNKQDLINDSNRRQIETLLERYRRIGYTVRCTSALSVDSDLQELEDLLQGQTSVFVGQSGVGKSSLIQRLLPGETLRIGDLSEGVRKGTHTTTTARLFHMPCGGDLIDSPGIREFGLWHITEEDLMAGFIELRPLIGHCRFRNCRHRGEPGCAIASAVDEGLIAPARFESFRRILQDVEAQQARGLTLEPRRD